jgi:hypothetical protein
MAIDSVTPVFREIATSAVPQVSLTRRDRELQIEEGQPPLEVASTEQQALRWQKSEDLHEKWKRQQGRHAGGQSSGEETPDADSVEEKAEVTEECATSIEEETGTLFDDRS